MENQVESIRFVGRLLAGDGKTVESLSKVACVQTLLTKLKRGEKADSNKSEQEKRLGCADSTFSPLFNFRVCTQAKARALPLNSKT